MKRDWGETAIRIREGLLRARIGIKTRLGILGPLKILAYRGYGTGHKVRMRGRVVEGGKDIPPAKESDTLPDNIRSMLRRLTRMPIPGARVAAVFQETRKEAVTDRQGFFTFEFSPDREPDAPLWHEVHLELLHPLPGRQPVRETGNVLTPPEGVCHVVISDIDDTVMPTEATSMLRMFRSLFTGNARTRLPFPGVAAFYRALHQGTDDRLLNPIMYVSRGPWNLYDLLCEFFNLHNIPIGPVLYLRHWGFSREGLTRPAPKGHKYRLISQMLDAYADIPFILVGDSGQMDPEIYAEVVKDHPGRVMAVYIRQVEPDPQRVEGISRLARKVAEAGSVLVLAEDTMEMARHAAEHGWIEPRYLADVEGEKIESEPPPPIP